MDAKKFVIAVVVTYIAFAVIAIVLNALFAGQMESLTALLLPEERQNMPYMLVGYLAYTIVFCYIFLQGHEGKGLAEGVRYGLLIGLLIGSTRIVFYAISTITAMTTIVWIVQDLIVHIVGGAVLAAVYRSSSNTDEGSAPTSAVE